MARHHEPYGRLARDCPNCGIQKLDVALDGSVVCAVCGYGENAPAKEKPMRETISAERISKHERCKRDMKEITNTAYTVGKLEVLLATLDKPANKLTGATPGVAYHHVIRHTLSNANSKLGSITQNAISAYGAIAVTDAIQEGLRLARADEQPQLDLRKRRNPVDLVGEQY